MDRIQSINPNRIQWCCADRGISPQELASEVGVSETTLDKVLGDDGGLTYNQLRKIAGYFNRGVLFFLESGPIADAQVYSPQFRTIANQKPELAPKLKALIERVEKQREVYLSLREDLGEADQLRFVAPDLPKGDIKLAADITRQWLGLAEKNDFVSYREAIEAKQILVFQSNGYNGPWQIPKESPICGFTLYDAICPVIVVKKMAYGSRQVFTLIHELGHILLHRSSYIDDEADLISYQGTERESNSFAGLVLVPQRFLDNIDDRARPDLVSQYDAWLKQYRDAWGVSGEVILRRLLDTGRLSQREYDVYREWRLKQVRSENTRGSRKYRYREPKNIFGEPFVQTVFDALHARHISLAKASTYLDNLRIADVHRLEGLYAGL